MPTPPKLLASYETPAFDYGDVVEVMRAMAEQRARVNRMMSWLDMAPVPPPQEGREA